MMGWQVSGGIRAVVGAAVAVMVSVSCGASGSAADKPKAKSTSSKAPICASDRDFAALNARVLQTELMVAALSCGERQRYNSFVTNYQKVLTDRGQALQALFKKTHGASSESRLNAFITKLANDSSQQVRSKGSEYCVFAAELFDEALATEANDFNRLSNKPWIVSRHGYRPCVVEASRKQAG